MNGAKSGDFTKKAIVKGILLIIAQSRISLYHSHTHSGAGCCWLIFCQPVVHRLLSYGNENDNGYDKHLSSQSDLIMSSYLRIILIIISYRQIFSNSKTH